MATRSSTSEFQPSPPNTRLRSTGGRVAARSAIIKAGSHPGVKSNLGCPPATNGERAFGKVAPSSPASAKAQKKTSPSIG
jgi:hypothetical protein